MTEDLYDEIKAADEALQDAVRRRVALGNREAKAALVRMLEYVPDVGFPHTVKPAYFDNKGTLKEYRKQNGLDDRLPFFTEGYLYELLGKEDARTILALLSRLARAIGYQGLWDLEKDIRAAKAKWDLPEKGTTVPKGGFCEYCDGPCDPERHRRGEFSGGKVKDLTARQRSEAQGDF